MGNSDFCFSDKQRSTLLACWKRRHARKAAMSFLDEAELIITRWQSELECNPPTSIKEQIELASDIFNNVENTPRLLDDLPKDFENFLAVIWLDLKYGLAYFQLHAAAHRKDAARNSARRLMSEAAAGVFQLDKKSISKQYTSEASKLPPNYFVLKDKPDADFLPLAKEAAGAVCWMLKTSKNWHNKSAEESLLYPLVLAYKHHFGLLPSAANAGSEGLMSPFRCFIAELCILLNLDIGSPLLRRVIETLKLRSLPSVD